MPIKTYKPNTPTQRFKTTLSFKDLTRRKSEKSLLSPLKRSGGRNSRGRITSRRRGGGHKRLYRKIDFKRDKVDIPARVASIEYDPNRSAFIALLIYADGEKSYILAPLGLKVDDTVIAGENVDVRVGNALPVGNLPLGTTVHNIELNHGKGGQLVRSAGAGAQVVAKEGNMAQLRLPSGEVRLIRMECYATVGEVGNLDRENVSYGKAGRMRWRGRRPKVRGVAMNPVDHPLGGGEGKSSGGRHPVTPWGQPTKGYKTRKKGQRSDAFIVKRRK